MTLPRLLMLGMLTALGASGQSQFTEEKLAGLVGTRVVVETTRGGIAEGHLTEVNSELITVQSFDPHPYTVQVAIDEVKSVKKPSFRGTRTDLLIRKIARVPLHGSHMVIATSVATAKYVGLFFYVVLLIVQGGGNWGP